MTAELPPNPLLSKNLRDWADRMYQFFLDRYDATDAVNPQPVLMPHRSADEIDRAIANGIMLYEPTYEVPVVSHNNEWKPMLDDVRAIIHYETAAAVAGAAFGASPNQVPFNTDASPETPPWFTFNAGTNDFTLAQGVYFVDGYFSIVDGAGGALNAFGYIAETSVPGTLFGTVTSGTVAFAAGAGAGDEQIVPVSGVLTVPAGGKTLSLQVASTAAGATFGAAHSIVGFQNYHAKLNFRLIGLNEA